MRDFAQMITWYLRFLRKMQDIPLFGQHIVKRDTVLLNLHRSLDAACKLFEIGRNNDDFWVVGRVGGTADWLWASRLSYTAFTHSNIYRYNNKVITENKESENGAIGHKMVWKPT